MSKIGLGWMAWEADGTNGYAHIAEKFHYHLLNDERFNFVNAYSEPWDALICVATPARFTIGLDLVPRRDIVFHTMFEAQPLPPGWIDVLNCAGMLWVPSKYSADLFHEAGVKTPTFIAGYGVAHREYTYIDRRQREVERGAPMKFILWADTLFSRKNVVKTVRAFIDAGLPNAELEVKLHSFAGMNAGTMFSDGKGRPLANISIHTGAWPRTKLVKWLHSADAGLYFSGGEGFGMQPLEAMATGLPMAVANNTGMMEYLKPGNHVPVNCPKMVKDMTYSLAYGYDAMTYEPDYEQAVEQIRWMYANRDKLHEIGDAGYAEAVQWDWKVQTKRAGDFIADRYGVK